MGNTRILLRGGLAVLLAGSVLVLDTPTAVTGAGLTHAVSSPAVDSKRPNVVVVMTDDMRVDELRFAPHVRRLVGADGLTFENSFSPYPSCCPARASFLTGVYTHNHRVWSVEPPWGYQAFDDSRTLATSLRRAGYQTGFIGKYLNGYGPHESKVSGRPSWRYVPRGWTDWRAAIDDGVAGLHGGTYNYFDTPYNVNGRVDNSHRGQYQTDVVGDFSAAMATRFGRSRHPFFMYVNFVAPHFGGPAEGDDPGWVTDRRGQRRRLLTPARPTWVEGRFDAVVTRAAGVPRGGGPTEKSVADKAPYHRRLPELNRQERRGLREVTRQRAESIAVMDLQVKRLIRTLKRTGEWDETVFMFTSDNGYFLGEHRQRQGKLLGHEPSLRVPFLVTGPGMRGRDGEGHLRYDPITTIDVSATILDLANARPPRPLDGSSQVTTMRDGDSGWSVPVLHETLHTGGRRGGGFDDVRTAIGVRTPRYSMLLYRNGAELYDLAVDAEQNRNVWRAEKYRPVRRRLLAVWQQLKDCEADECRAELPLGLQAGPRRNRSLTRDYWRQIDRVYGW